MSLIKETRTFRMISMLQGFPLPQGDVELHRILCEIENAELRFCDQLQHAFLRVGTLSEHVFEGHARHDGIEALKFHHLANVFVDLSVADIMAHVAHPNDSSGDQDPVHLFQRGQGFAEVLEGRGADDMGERRSRERQSRCVTLNEIDFDAGLFGIPRGDFHE